MQHSIFQEFYKDLRLNGPKKLCNKTQNQKLNLEFSLLHGTVIII